MLMRIAIVQFRGSDKEHACVSAISRAGMQPETFFWDESPEKLHDFAAYVVVDGDRLQFPGALAEIERQSELGKLVLGLGNGAKLLVASGLVPGLENNKVAMALTDSKDASAPEIVHLCLSKHYQRNAYTRYLTPKTILRVAVSGLKRFAMPPALQAEIENQGLNVLQYCDERGVIVEQGNIAALSNKAGNVLAIVPEVELGDVGDAIFKSMHDYLEQPHFVVVLPLSYYPRRILPKAYQPAVDAKICVVESKASDEQALLVEHFLQQRRMAIRLQRKEYSEVEGDEAAFQRLLDNGATAVSAESLSGQYLVLAKDEMQGVRSGVIWQLSGSSADIDLALQLSVLQRAWLDECYLIR